MRSLMQISLYLILIFLSFSVLGYLQVKNYNFCQLTGNQFKYSAQGNASISYNIGEAREIAQNNPSFISLQIFDDSMHLLDSKESNEEILLTPIFPDPNSPVTVKTIGIYSYNILVVVDLHKRFYFSFIYDDFISRYLFYTQLILLLVALVLIPFINRLKVSHETIERLASMASFAHDFRGPISIFQRNANQLPLKSREYVLKTLDTVKGMIDDVLSLNTDPKSLDPVNIEECYKSAKQLILSNTDHITIRTQIPNLIILGNKNRTSRIFYNLLHNAINYCDGLIEIKAYSEKDHIIVSFMNTGEVLSRRQVSQIFKPFRTFNSKSGSGLGLFITKRFTESQKGTIKCCSSNGVTRFILKFEKIRKKNPKEQSENLKISVKKNTVNKIDYPNPSIFSNNYRVAIVDDENFYTDFLFQEFNKNNFQSTCFSHPELLFQALVSGVEFDVIISDRFFPNYDALSRDLPHTIRSQFDYKGLIILHSNSILSEKNNFDLEFSKSQELDYKGIAACIKEKNIHDKTLVHE